MNLKPFEVEVTRGSKVESRHTVHAVIFSHQSSLSQIYGDPTIPVFPRSSIKPIQALPLLLTGAAQAFNVSSSELALACASHRGETIHTEPIREWLKRIGLDESHLECGAHPPGHQESLAQLLKSNGQPTAIHNNCSGKHTGMLATALHMGEPTKNYVSYNHPVQQRINKYLEKLCDIELRKESFGVDGCSIPAPCLPLVNLAKGFCEFAAPTRISADEAVACKQLFEAFVTHPVLTSGTGQYCSEVMQETKERVLIKGGAEGVIIAAIPELQVGMALKTVDGNSRASEFCASIILQRLGLLDSKSTFLSPKFFNWNKIETGEIRLKQ